MRFALEIAETVRAPGIMIGRFFFVRRSLTAWWRMGGRRTIALAEGLGTAASTSSTARQRDLGDRPSAGHPGAGYHVVLSRLRRVAALPR